MSLNCNEINAVLSELNPDGSFIQDIVQPGYDTLALYTYGKNGARTLLICTAQNSCRIHETRRKIVKNDRPLRFMECLKSRIKGARIDSCAQIGLQRIVRFELSHADGQFVLYARLWSNAANVLLCDKNGIIIDSLYRRPAKGEITGGLFVVPEEQSGGKKDWPVRQFDEIQRDYAARHSGAEKLSLNQKIDIWYGEYAASLSRDALLLQAEKWYAASKTRMESALERLLQKQAEFSHAEQLRHQGDLILAHQHLIAPDAHFLECEDYDTGRTVRILLNPQKSAHENAADFYERYKKAVSGAEALCHDIELSKKRLEKLESLYSEMKNEQNPVRLEQLLRRDATPKQQQKKKHPGLDYSVDGWLILVGRDANENDELLRRHVRGSDLWLHTRDFPGGYVFIKNRPGKTVPLDILLDAANLAVYYSKARTAGKTDLYYTQVKYLRRAKNGPKGLVLPTHEKNLCIVPDKKRLERLDGQRQESL